jgi:hypothetical protein
MSKTGVYGDWDKVGDSLFLLKSKMSLMVLEEVQKVALKFLDELKKHIDTQDLPFAPLSPITIKLKGDDRWWIESGDFKENLGWSVKTGKSKFSVEVGALESVPYNARQSDINNMYELAVRLEYGWGKIPSRPLFATTFELMENDFKRIEKDLNIKFQGIWV